MSRRNRRCLGNLLLDLVIFFIWIFTMVIQPTSMFLFEVPSILEFCHIQPSLLGSQLSEERWRKMLSTRHWQKQQEMNFYP